MKDQSRAADNNGDAWPKEERGPAWINTVALLVWLLAGTVPFLPFAFDTSPWDAVTLRVPGNQGNWWHLLAGAPFFLAFPIIWLRLRSLFAVRFSTALRRVIWAVVALSIVGTILVEVPFLFHQAGTSAWQRLAVLSLGFGIVVASGIILLLRRRQISPTRACFVGLDAAYLANASLCLIVYSEAAGTVWSRAGWFVAAALVGPISFELIWLLAQTFSSK